MTTTPDPRCSDRCQALTIESGPPTERTRSERLADAGFKRRKSGKSAGGLMRDEDAAGTAVECGPLTDIHGVVAGEAQTELTDERLNAAIEAALPLLDAKARKALTFTRSIDGIECEYLTVYCRGFVAGVLMNIADGTPPSTNKDPA